MDKSDEIMLEFSRMILSLSRSYVGAEAIVGNWSEPDYKGGGGRKHRVQVTFRVSNTRLNRRFETSRMIDLSAVSERTYVPRYFLHMYEAMCEEVREMTESAGVRLRAGMEEEDNSDN